MLKRDKAKLNNIEKGSEEVIYRVEAFFPFDFFPNSISVDKNKIDIVYRHFLWTKDVFSIFLTDLTNMTVSTGPLFATAKFEVRGYESNPEPISYLKISEAIKLREIVIGLTKATRENINIDTITPTRVKKLQKIGNTGEKLTAAI